MNHVEIKNPGSFLLFNPAQPMQFPGLEFFFLFSFFMLGFILIKKRHSAKMAFAVAFSLYFYYLTDGFTVIALISSVLANFCFSYFSVRTDTSPTRRSILAASIVTNIGFLLYVKYSHFLVTQVHSLSSGSPAWTDIAVPLGVSFYTFQAISYQVDIYRQKGAALGNILDFAFYLCFFPKLLAGPLVRLSAFRPQILKDNPITKETVDRGLSLIIAGLFKKMLIADYIGANFVDRIFASPAQFSGIENLAAVYAYALQIYCDFSGYTDIALGIALFMGYKLPPNFNSPYLAADVREFWQRWHISLSLWFRDYLYIPLGGSRRGRMRQCVNYMIIMGLCGLWHGASWNFIIWGLMHGLGLVASSFLTMKMRGLKRILGIVVTFHFVCFAWIFFRAESMSAAFDVLGRISGSVEIGAIVEFLLAYRYVMVFMCAGYMLHFLPVTVKSVPIHVISRLPLPLQSLSLAGTLWLIMQMKTSQLTPFIYLQF